MKKYQLPELPYGYSDLEPVISNEQLSIHHKKHHQGYVDNTNSILEELEDARKKGDHLDYKAVLKNLSFNLSGHMLHSWFWENMRSPQEENKPLAETLKLIEGLFGSFDRFKEEFHKAAKSVEGSGWAALVQGRKSEELFISQIEKHNQNMYPDVKYLLVLDVWEHAYYLDYKNERGGFIENFWKVVNWEEVEKRLVK